MQDDVTNLTTLLSDEEWIALIEGQPLPAGRAQEVRAILQRHPQLAELAAQMQGDREALSVIDVQRKSGSGDVVPPADLLERIEQTLEREALVGLATIEAKAPAAEELPRYVPAAVRSRREPLVPARWIGPLGLAASLLVVAGGAVLVWQSSRPGPVEPMLVGATGSDRAGATDRTMQIAVKDSSKESGTPGAGSSGPAEPMVTPTETSTTLAAKEPEPAPTVTADPAARTEQSASPVTIAVSPSTDATEATRLAPDSAAAPPAAPTAKVAAAEPLSDEALLAAALEGRLVAIVTPASMQRRMDIDQRMAKLTEQPMALAPVQRISVEMATGQAASQVALNAFTQQVVLADGIELLPAEVRSRLNVPVAQGEPVSPAGPGGSDPQTVARGHGGSGDQSPAMPSASTPGVAPASVMQPMNQGAHMLTLPRLGRATTPATSSGIALLRRSLTGSSDEVLLVVLPPAAEGEDAARVWLAMTGIDDPVMRPWDAGEILWWTAPTQQITPRVVVPVLVTPGKRL